MKPLQQDHELILGVLSHRGLVSSRDLQLATGKSQATISRLLSDLSNRVVTLGQARATRYGLPKLIRGNAARQPIWWTDERGAVHQIGTLTFLAGDNLHVETEYVQSTTIGALPWYLAPLHTQGFLGRLHAQRLEASGVASNPEQWNLETILFSALNLHDPSGAITIGEPGARPPHQRLPSSSAAMGQAMDALARDVAKTLPAGSSAGGEQPKFLAVLASGKHVLVKFTPPKDSPFGRRWHDLLHAEALASRVLRRHGVTVASTEVVESDERTYLVSERFDRIGESGRRHVVAIGDVHKALVADSYMNWASSAAALARQGHLSSLDAQRASALLSFGRLIGNSDMHSGNLSLLVRAAELESGRFDLAPVYDMLPMRWRPDPALGGLPDYGPFDVDGSAASGSANGPARAFWDQLSTTVEVSAGLRDVAAEMRQRLATARMS